MSGWYHCLCCLIVQVISTVTGNKSCVSNIADSNVLQYLLLVLHMLPSCEYATPDTQAGSMISSPTLS